MAAGRPRRRRPGRRQTRRTAPARSMKVERPVKSLGPPSTADCDRDLFHPGHGKFISPSPRRRAGEGRPPVHEPRSSSRAPAARRREGMRRGVERRSRGHLAVALNETFMMARSPSFSRTGGLSGISPSSRLPFCACPSRGRTRTTLDTINRRCAVRSLRPLAQTAPTSHRAA